MSLARSCKCPGASNGTGAPSSSTTLTSTPSTALPALDARFSTLSVSRPIVVMPASVIPQDGINSAPSSRLVRPPSCGGVGPPPPANPRHAEHTYVHRPAAEQDALTKQRGP